MPHLLDGLLPEPAASLYQKLLGAGKLRLAEYPELADSDELRVLIDRGFARHRHVGDAVIVPIEPMRAIENALLVTQRRILEQHRMPVRVLEQMGTLHQAYVSGGAEPEDASSAIQLLVDPAQIGALSVELCLSAQRHVSNLETGQFRQVPDPRSARVPPKDVVDRGVGFRTVYARAALDVPGAAEMFERCAAGGWRQRVLTELPMKMVLVDERAALLPLDPTGMDGAVLIRAPVILAMLLSYFEMLWRRAVPLRSFHMRRSMLAVAMTLALIPAGVGATAQASTAAPAAGPAVAFSCPFYENGRTFYATTIFHADNCFSTPKSTMYMQADGNLVLFN